MLFSSLTFLYLFLPMSIILYYVGHENKWRNAILLIFSLLFYASGEPLLIIVLLVGFIHNYSFAILIERTISYRTRGALLAMSVAINLATLIFFKYYNFIATSVNEVLRFVGLNQIGLPDYKAPLPLGISFYTFQIMTYVIDVYRRTTAAQKSPIKLLMYEVSFHQLVAGPIVRYKDIETEIENRKLSLSRFSGGITRFVAGLGKKVIFANTCGDLCEQFLGRDPSTLSTAGAWIGITLFALQIYFDFSGYSDMAIGMGHMFGFTYKENFDYPYISKSATEFWRRWHMSLGAFFRDYVYIPLGGNRFKQYRNLAIVWFLTGLWHGASWNFVIWGMYFFVLIMIEKLFLSKVMSYAPARVSSAFGHVWLIFCVLVGWVFFYFEDLSSMTSFLSAMFGRGGGGLVDVEVAPFLWANASFIALSVVAATPLPMRIFNTLKTFAARHRTSDSIFYGVLTPIYNASVLIISTVMLAGDSYNPFLYFRF